MMYELVFKHPHMCDDEVFVRSHDIKNCLEIVKKYNINVQPDYDKGEEYNFYIKEIKPVSLDNDFNIVRLEYLLGQDLASKMN